MAAKKKTARKTSKKPASKAATKTASQKVAKKAVAKKAPAKKTPAKNTAKNTAKKPAAVVIASITPTKDGASWTVKTNTGDAIKLPTGAAQSAGIKVGGAWSPTVLGRVLEAQRDQELFTKAMAMLAKDGKTSRAQLEKSLGGDAGAKRAVATLAKNGWIA
jgi:hypothetical protein